MLAIYGPTVTGKTNLAIKLAKKLGGEIISADSRQVYQSLDIGTGKVSFDSKVDKHEDYWIVDNIKIHGFDLVKPTQPFSVADFLNAANSAMMQITESKKLPIVVVGTCFYIKAMVDGIDSIGIPQNEKLRSELEKLSTEALYQKLLDVDPNRAEEMNQSDKNNPRRLIRAIEIAESKQKQTGNRIPATSYHLIGLTAPNDYLYERADDWLKERLNRGMVGEVKKLIDSGVSTMWLENLGLEYRWLTRHLAGKVPLDVATERLRGEIHSLIRRQKNWFSQFKEISLFDISEKNWQGKLEKQVELWYISKANG
jgi:tRNA dimethylallyltransferase